MKKKTAPRMMRTKTAHKESQKTDRQTFAILRGRIKKLGFYEKSPDWLIKLLIEKDLIPPDSERIPETFDQFVYSRKINGYTILFFTSFNPTIYEILGERVNGAFAKKGGSLWILVVDENGQRVITRQRFRTATMNDRIPLELECLIWGLKKRPMHPSGKSKMFLWDPSSKKIPSKIESSCAWYKENVLKKLKKKDVQLKYEPIWLSTNTSTNHNQHFSKGMPDSLSETYSELIRRRSYYWSIERKRRKTKNTIRKIRKPWKKKDELVNDDSSKNYAVSLHC